MGDLLPNKITDFFNYAKERYSIYLKRQAGEPWPWTDDQVLQTYKFCNIFRENDIGTIWLREHIREPFADHPNLFFNICMYRQFNRVETAELIGFLGEKEFDPDLLYITVNKRKQAGLPIYTNAHMVRSAPRGICADKLTYTVYLVLKPLWNNLKELEPGPGDTLELAYRRLLRAYGFGSFLSYEVITDLRHTRYLNQAPDIMTWANAGPGAVRGINRIAGEPLKAHHNQRYYLRNMRELLDYSRDYIPDMPPWEMRDVEHTLCEFDKYERCWQGGRTRMKYKRPISG